VEDTEDAEKNNKGSHMKLFWTTLLLLPVVLFAELKVGADFPSLLLQDQHKNKVEVPHKDTKYILFSANKKVSSKIKKFIDFKGVDFLEKHHIQYVSDISKMPTIITKYIAIPKMKKFNFKIALIYSEKDGKALPRKKGRITLIKLKNKQITKIDFIAPTQLFKTFP